jgi:hypothetical protein
VIARFVLFFVASGCAVPVGVGVLDDGATSGVGETTTDGSTSSTGVVEPDTQTGTDTGVVGERRELAFREGDIPPADDDTTAGSSAGTDGGSEIDPDALRIVIGTSEITCDDFYGAMPCDRWELSFSLAPALQVVGATGSLEDHLGFWSERPGAEPDCAGGGGTLTGSFEITSIDTAEVRGRLTNLGPALELAPTELEFTALRCD